MSVLDDSTVKNELASLLRSLRALADALTQLATLAVKEHKKL